MIQSGHSPVAAVAVEWDAKLRVRLASLGESICRAAAGFSNKGYRRVSRQMWRGLLIL